MNACIEQAATVRRRLQMHRALRTARSRSLAFVTRVSAALLLGALAPAMLLARLLGARVASERRSGQRGQFFNVYTLVKRNGQPLPVAANWPRLLNVARGEVCWVGPEAKQPAAVDFKLEQSRRIAAVKPGLVCSWWVRQRTNVAYATQAETDFQYVDSHSLKADLGIGARALLAMAYGRPGNDFTEQTTILGLPLDNLTLAQAAEEIVRPATTTRQVSFVNVDCVNVSCRDTEYRLILRSSALRLADGIGLRVAGKLLRSEVRQNVNGTDLFPVLCTLMAERGLSIYLLGGRPGVAEDVAARVSASNPGLKIAGTRNGYFAASEEAAVIAEINASGADVLLVAFGAPLQEKWIRRNQHRLRVRSALGVGGLFDFYSGRTPRAPQWLRELGLEWSFRLYQEPGRMWRRYLLGNVVFLTRVMAAKFFGAYRSPDGNQRALPVLPTGQSST